MRWLEKAGVFESVPIDQAREQRRPPYTLKWVDKLKQDPATGKWACRCRLVVREIKAAKKPGERLSEADMYASMPPVEGLTLLCSVFATTAGNSRG